MKISPEAISHVLQSAPGKAGGNDAFQDFESMLLAQVLKGGDSSFGGSHSLSGGSAGKMYRELHSEELARNMAAAGGVGIAARLRADAASDTEDGR